MDCFPSFNRFIPACAGNSQYEEAYRPVDTVHPRVCGEQVLVLFSKSFVPGSSPRVRGTDKGVKSVKPVGRFIPACAGNR